MWDLLMGTFGAFLILGGFIFFVLAWRLLMSSRAAYNDAHHATKTLHRAATGSIPPVRGGIRDHRVAAGLSLTKDNKWRVEGRLSNETVGLLAGRRSN